LIDNDDAQAATSPSKPAVLQVACHGVEPSKAAKLFNIKTTTIHKATKIQIDRRLRHILRPTIHRDRISQKKPALVEFLKESIVNPSGRDKNYYFGTPESMYENLMLRCSIASVKRKMLE